MFAVFLPSTDFLLKSTTTLSKIILRVHEKAQPQQSSTAKNWLVEPEKNTDSADGTGPASSRDPKNSRLATRVNGEFSETFCILWSVAVPLRHFVTTAETDCRISILRKPTSSCTVSHP